MRYIEEDKREEGLDHSYMVPDGHLAGKGKGLVVVGQDRNWYAAPWHDFAEGDLWGPGSRTHGRLSARGVHLGEGCLDVGSKAWVA